MHNEAFFNDIFHTEKLKLYDYIDTVGKLDQNLYRYCANRPTFYYDKLGLFTSDYGGGFGTGVIVGDQGTQFTYTIGFSKDYIPGS